MMNFAFAGTQCEELSKHLEGPNAIAISANDATAPARILAKHAKAIKPMELIALLATNGKLVKRPLVVTDSFVLVGFKPDEWEKLK